jgi:pantoate--beta-alanine ligase
VRKISFKEELIQVISSERSKGKTIGFVPTMGALHEGHLDLIRASKKEASFTVCSIFINPTQFNNQEDLINYPRTETEDIEKLKRSGCDLVFIPAFNEIYPESENPLLSFDFGEIATKLEGEFRPGHFNGVGLVVSKLFNIVRPDMAFFGQKDLQQFAIIKKLVHSLSYPIRLVCVPTRREPDGLAMSSRNLRINKENRPVANMFYKALLQAITNLNEGKDATEVKSVVRNIFDSQPLLKLEYFEFVDTDTFAVFEGPIRKGNTALVIAGYMGNIRLIDNVMYI